MQRAVILDVAALADLDPLVVAAQHGAEPDAGARLDPHLADDDGVFRHITGPAGAMSGLCPRKLKSSASCKYSVIAVGTARDSIEPRRRYP